MGIYLYSSRPPGIGCQPDGWVDRETWLPAREVNGRHHFGKVEYNVALSFEAIRRYELWPENELERAEMVFWREGPDADWLRTDYLAADEELLQELKSSDAKAWAALVIRSAGTGL